MPDLDAIRERLAAATPGPWDIHRYKHGGGRICIDDTAQSSRARDLIADVYDEGNRELLYHAPADIAALLAENERLREIVARVGTDRIRGYIAGFQEAAEGSTEAGLRAEIANLADAHDAAMGKYKGELNRLRKVADAARGLSWTVHRLDSGEDVVSELTADANYLNAALDVLEGGK